MSSPKGAAHLYKTFYNQLLSLKLNKPSDHKQENVYTYMEMTISLNIILLIGSMPRGLSQFGGEFQFFLYKTYVKTVLN